MKHIVAIRPGLLLPVAAARMAATFDRLSSGRLLVNIVNGADPAEMAGDGVFLSHDERCAITNDSWISGGHRWRALLAQPSLLLLYEPLSELDALTRLEMQALIESVWQKHRSTLVLVTHDVEETVAIADRVLVMDGGMWILKKRIELKRPRLRSDSRFVRYRTELLDAILNGTPSTDLESDLEDEAKLPRSRFKAHVNKVLVN